MHVCALQLAQLALLALGCVAVRASEDVVHIKSKYSAPPLITSSTLRWVKKSMGARSEAAVVGAYEIVPGDNTNGEDEENLNEVLQRDVYVCRARHNGEWLAGVLRSGHPACHVALGNHVFRYNDYEVLDNEDKGARLSWERWDRFTGTMPVGAVAAGDNYIARRKVEEPGDGGRGVLGFTHLLGQIEKRGFQGLINVVDQNDKAAEFQDGEVLVETEPIRYELTVTSFNHKRQKVKRQSRVLGQTTLRNGGGAYAVNVDSAMAYDANYSLYYGQGRAILKGLPTVVHLPDAKPSAKPTEEFKWGIPVSEERKDVHRVEAHLGPGTAVNVTLVGNHTDTETPYTGKLVAVYPDGETRARTIGGSRREVAMLDVHPELGPVFFLSNDSLVPTTTTTTTTTTSTTTTTTTTTTSTTTEEPSTPAHTKKPKKTLPGESEGPGHKGENSSMMSDEGDVLDQGATPQREAVVSESSTAPPSAVAATILTLALPCVLLQALRIA